MKVKLLKDKIDVIESSFKVLLEDNNSEAALDNIKEALEKSFEGYTFDVTIVPHKSNEASYIMSVFPEKSTMDKMIKAMALNDSSKDIVKSLWKENKNWFIEIDSLTLDGTFTEKELTALLLHEIGHIAISNSVPRRVSTILQYYMISAKSKDKLLLRDKIFRSLMSLPILEICVRDNVDSVKEEVKADGFAKKFGYTNELESALNKVIKHSTSKSTSDEKMNTVAKFAVLNLDNLQKRKHNLIKKSIFNIKEGTNSPYIESVLDDFINIYEDSESGSFSTPGKSLEVIESRISELTSDEYIMEFVIGKKKMKRLEPSDIDYIAVKSDTITSDTDKMMLLTYLHSKLDLCEYYISILSNPKTAKKYVIPNTLSELERTRERLSMLREKIIRQRLPEKTNGIYIQFGNSMYV